MSINLIPFHKKLRGSCYISPDSYLPNWVKKAIENDEMSKYYDLFNPDIKFRSDLDSYTAKRLDAFVLTIIDIKQADKTIKIPKTKYNVADFVSNKSLVKLLNDINIISLKDLSEIGFYRLVNSYGNFGILKVLNLINDICYVDQFDQVSVEINYKTSNELIDKYIKDFKIPLNILSINDPRFFDIKKTLSIYIDQNEDGNYLYSILKSLSNEFSTDKIEQILTSIKLIIDKIDSMSLQDQMEDFFISHIRNSQKSSASLLDRFDVIKERLGINTSEEDYYTLEQVGQLAGLTRERIRQLEKKILEAVKYTDDEIYIPKLIEINNYLKLNLHNDIDSMTEGLNLLGYGKWNISRLLGCLDLFRIKNNYQIVEDILCVDGDEALVKHILTTAKKIISYNGLVEINQLNLAVNQSMSTGIDTIKRVLQAEFIEVEDGWFYVERSSNVLISIAKRMANFSKEFPTQDLREGHRKYAKLRSSGFAAEGSGRLFYGFITPSSSSIKKLFDRHIDDFHVRENNIICDINDNSFLINNEGEGSVDSQFLNYFRARNFEPATMSELQKFFIIDNDMSEGTFHVYLTYRPYTKQYSRSVWGIVGHPPSELTLENTINRIQKNPPTKTEWARSGEVKYKLRASTGVQGYSFIVGKDFDDILGEQSYNIYHNNKVYCEIKRSGPFWYGAGKYLSNILFCELYDYLAFYFNIEDSSVRVEIISEAEYDE
tara:strand:- start:127 stop:2277 length:2151 start_codon:yes stop_codon:yes gene_type:complete